ncbi:hypothetical protein F5Y10DRAFT_245301 [Nemania abortiva]|nr:hypothetical protein F5Y10DRAFT_245301 [Nemania abortiva]
MLEYFSYKKVKKHREEKAAKQKLDKGKEKEKICDPENAKEETAAAGSEAKLEESTATPPPQIISQPPDDKDDDDDDNAVLEGAPVLDREDEKFLERLTSSDASLNDDGDEGPPPPLPPRVKTPVIDLESDTSSVESKEVGKEGESKGKGKENEKEKEQKDSSKSKSDTKHKRFTFTTSFLHRRSNKHHPETLDVPAGAEASTPHETTDLARVLDDLDLSAKNNRAFSLSAESAAMVRRFTQVLKDLVNGVPTAYGDLVSLLDDRDGLLARNFEKLPSSLKKLVAQLPEKLTTSFAPELLAVAAEAQGLEASKEGGLKDAAKKFLTPANLHDLVTKPGALVGLLKGIVNALKTRFPAFVGTNVLWSLAVFLLLSMLWYCHKRGREVRLEREATEAAEAEGVKVDEAIGGPRVEELPDDPMLDAPKADTAREGAGGGEVKAS